MTPKPLWHYFKSFFVVWGVASAALFLYGGVFALFQGSILSVLELSLSFDNAVVNAMILATMSLVWRDRFLLWGMIIAVFGVRFLLPIVIVYLSTSLGFGESFSLALNNPHEYERIIGDSHHIVMAFGGMFLLMIFFKFLFDEEKDDHWIAWIEHYAAKLSKVGDLKMVMILALMLVITYVAPNEVLLHDKHVTVPKIDILAPMLIGMILFYLLEFLTGFIEHGKTKHESKEMGSATVATGGLISFLYLELIDMSFSLDGVLGAFAITQNVIIIMLGLGIGAMAVRSLTLYMVDYDVVNKYEYLEHGAMWSIGFLALSMLVQIFVHIPEVVITTMAIIPIALAFFHSIHKNKQLLTHGLS